MIYVATKMVGQKQILPSSFVLLFETLLRTASAETGSNQFALQLLYLEPLVDTLGVELVCAGQNAHQLPRFKIAHADHADSLVRVRSF
jgi:hypothetical protein